MFETACTVNSFLLTYIEGLLQDIPEEQMAERPAVGVNPPAWILGHLAWTSDFMASVLGAEPTLPPDWAKKYGQGSEPSAERSDYPSKAELLETLKERFAAFRELVANVDLEKMAAPNPNPRLRDGGLATVGDLTNFVLTGHVGIHAGQLSTWRRIIGKPRLF